ncbi:MAG TPA: radical SAM protein [Thermoanaerobaculia bacterium]|nr:radical SAM protein [Thermoanaerobaculia bacterium]
MTRGDAITELPILILYPHARCNCRCLMCDIWKEREPRELTAAEIARWTDEWRALGIRRIVLSGGEPLMHSGLWALCRPLSEAGISLTLLSSGLLLARDAARIAETFDDVIVSLDGPRDVHDAVRNVPRAYDRMHEGIAAVRREAASRGRSIALSARSTVQRANFGRLRDTVSAARELGLDSISFLAADVRSEAFNRPGGWDAARASDVALGAEDLPRLAEELEALFVERAADFESGFIAESPAKLRARLHGYFAALLGVGEFPTNRCNAPWVSSVIESDGTVRPCFFHAPIGNVREAGSLAAVLNSPGTLAFRGALDVATNPVCKACVCTLDLQR